MNLTPYLIRGLATGGQFALVAIGYTMVYGILKLINFAHGDLFMLSGIMMIYLAASFPTMPMWVTILIMIALTVFVGFAIEKCAYSPLRTAPRMSVMISAIGVSYLLQNLVCYVTGGLAKQFPDIPLISQSVRVFGVKDKLAVFISPLVAVVLMVILVLIINHTKFGMSMRAVSKDFETAQLMGVKINRVISMTFIIGSFLAAVGALLYFTNYPGHQGVYRRCGGRHRLRARRCGGRTAHRRGGESGKSLRTGGFQRCYLVCTADYHSGHQTHGPLRRENDGEGVRG